MKKLKIFIASILFLFLSLGVMAQGAPPPPGEHNTGNDDVQGGGGAPLASGLLILTGFVAAYAGKKAYDYKNKTESITKDA